MHSVGSPVGNEPLTEELKRSRESLLELPTEEVQPICWSRAEAFFRLGDDVSHQRAFSPTAWCYMLSHQPVAAAPEGQPLGQPPRTFCSYLLRRTLHKRAPGTAPPLVPAIPVALPLPEHIASDLIRTFSRMCAAHIAQGHESVSGPGSSLIQTAAIRRRLPQLLQSLNARFLLDAPCGDFHWMATLNLGIDRYLGIDVLEELIRCNTERYTRPGRVFETSNLLADPLPKADVILCRDCLGHFTSDQVRAALKRGERLGLPARDDLPRAKVEPRDRHRGMEAAQSASYAIPFSAPARAHQRAVQRGQCSLQGQEPRALAIVRPAPMTPSSQRSPLSAPRLQRTAAACGGPRRGCDVARGGVVHTEFRRHP